MSNPVDLYNNVYSDFASNAEAAVRHATYGEDIGQSSWITAAAWLGYADRLQVTADSHVLEVGSGSGGPAVYLASKRGCRVTGVDINPHGVENAGHLAAAKGLIDRVKFLKVDASRPLPFQPSSFDAVVSNDAMCHIHDRHHVLSDWHRVVRPKGRILFTDAMVITGIVSHQELATRSSIGFYLFLPPGENERLITQAGFRVLAIEDVTDDEAMLAARWHDAREQHRQALVEREGAANFDGLQQFLVCTRRLAEERRMCRFCYLAEK